jgi:hypothetical protein
MRPLFYGLEWGLGALALCLIFGAPRMHGVPDFAVSVGLLAGFAYWEAARDHRP